jgi:hypothetical protein
MPAALSCHVVVLTKMQVISEGGSLIPFAPFDEWGERQTLPGYLLTDN